MAFGTCTSPTQRQTKIRTQNINFGREEYTYSGPGRGEKRGEKTEGLERERDFVLLGVVGSKLAEERDSGSCWRRELEGGHLTFITTNVLGHLILCFAVMVRGCNFAYICECRMVLLHAYLSRAGLVYHTQHPLRQSL